MTLVDLIEARVRPLAQALLRTGLHSVRIAEDGVEIELSRSGASVASAATGDPTQPDRVAGEPPDYDVLTSEIVGRVRFLRPPVTVGTLVEGERELAFIEALGTRNPVRSHLPGRVAVVYVEEGQAVDYGAPLFAIDKSRV